ncbi:MAG TPA: hypothetical protein VN578_12565 [Candidatus Binatia bacterium]|nr:hypothetical protein [Candidatus Binatia bacterium]
MVTSRYVLIGLLAGGLALAAEAGPLKRIGHTTLTPRHSSPDDKGMYTAFIDPTNGYAYFVGSYLFKLDITGNLPVQIGPATNTGQFINNAFDAAAGYVYFPGGTLKRYAVGAGANPVTNAGSLTLAAGTAAAVVLDDSDPNPANHYAYVLCTVSGSPARVAKVALSNFTEQASVTLNAGETNFLFGSVVDAQKGYAYFVTAPNTNSSPAVVKIKLTPGANAPVRIGAVSLNSVGTFIDGGSIDTLHGYAYYDTYDSDTNIPGKIFKVKLEAGDVAPTLVGYVNLHPGEGRLAASVCDPAGGYVYFANDNSYPGGVYQFSLNGTNLPVEISFLPFPGGPDAPPPNGMTTNNTTTNLDGILPFGEVFLRSAVFDPVRGYAYFGQDSRPNQVVKIQVARDTPVITNSAMQPGNGFRLTYTNTPGVAGTVLASTNLSLPMSNWNVLGVATEISSGQFQFTDPQSTNNPQRFYEIRSP